MAVTGRRRLWRWALAAWAVAVAVAGGLTLWLQDSAEQPGPYGWEEATPTPSLSATVDWRTLCPSATPAQDGSVLCFVRTRP